MHILLIEDDPSTASYAFKGLTEVGHVVDVLENGKEGMVQAIQTPYDVLIVDRMLPGMDGLSLVKALRVSGNKTPVLF
ncbi:MAG: response regulator [Granulosicoccaceae bacterium]